MHKECTRTGMNIASVYEKKSIKECANRAIWECKWAMWNEKSAMKKPKRIQGCEM